MKLTTSQAIIQFIKNQYFQLDENQPHQFIDQIGAIFGHGNVIGLGQAIYENRAFFRCYNGRNEQGLGHMGIGYAKQNNRTKAFLVTTSIGPGSTNLITAASCATINHIPLLMIVGDVFNNNGYDPVLQQLENNGDASVSVVDSFKPVCKYFAKINHPQQIIKILPQVFATLVDPMYTGSVCLALCQDVAGQVYEYPTTFFKKSIWKLNRIIPTNKDLDAFVLLLKNSKQPLIVAGGGAKYSFAHQAVLQFIEQTKIPIAFSNGGKSLIVDDHFLNLNGIGVLGSECANLYAKSADLIIGIGTRYSDFTTCSNTLFANEKHQVININVRQIDLLKNNPNLMIQADIKTFFDLVIQKQEIKDYLNPSYPKVVKYKKMWQKKLKKLTTYNLDQYLLQHYANDLNQMSAHQFATQMQTNLLQAKLILKINQLIPKNSVVIGASGSLPGDLQRLWNAQTIDSYHLEYGYSTMGYEIAGGIGAKIALNQLFQNKFDVPVFIFVGDGAFNMLHSELITAMENNIKVIVCLFDNASFGCINNLQVNMGCDNFLTEFKKVDTNEFIKINYAHLVKSYQLDGTVVTKFHQLKKALNNAIASQKSYLIDFKIPPKSMTIGYQSFWATGLNDGLDNKNANEAKNLLTQKKAKSPFQ